MVSSSAVVSSVLLLAAPGAFGHGYLNKPPARNVVMNSDYCKQCLAAGGPGTVYPSGNHGLCGDPYAMPEPRKHEAGGIYYNGGQSTATYSEGDTVDFNVVLTAYHKGDFRFRVCRIEGTTPEDERNQLEADRARTEEAAKLRDEDYQLAYAVDILRGLAAVAPQP